MLFLQCEIICTQKSVGAGIGSVPCASALPHHHHDGGAFCASVKLCQKDGRVNDEHTHHCHNPKLDQHHLFVPVGQKELHALHLLDGGDSFLDVGFGGFGPFLPCGFWKGNSCALSLYASVGRTLFASAPVALLACCHGKHWKRRGPPTVQ